MKSSRLVQIRQLFFCALNSVNLDSGATAITTPSTSEYQLVTVGHLNTACTAEIFKLYLYKESKRHLLCIIRQFKLCTDRECCSGQKTCCPLTNAATEEHEADRRVPTDMIHSVLIKVV